MKTIILYWIVTAIFALFFIIDGASGIFQIEAGLEIMRHLGYPDYLLIILGIAKVAGGVALLQNRFQTLKEWAYAGFTFHFIGAFASRAFIGDSFGLIISPFLFMAVMALSYFLWKKAFKINQVVIA